MSYNPYNNYNSGQYGQYGGGGGGYSTNGGYNSYNSGSSGRYDPFGDQNAAAAGSHEMSSLGNSGPNQASSSQNVLAERSRIQQELQEVERMLAALPGYQKRCLEDTDTSINSQSKRELDRFKQEIMDKYRKIAERIRDFKRIPQSAQLGNVSGLENQLRRAIQRFQELDAAFGKDMEAQAVRQLRIVRPDMSDEEIQKAVQSNNAPVFEQALMGSARLGQAQEVLRAVEQRHQEMLHIERQLEELLNLLNDMQELLAKQEVTVMEIDQQAEAAAGDMVKANEQLEVAVTTARKTRKKKWICLGICVAIVVIVVVIVVAYIMINRAANGGGGGGGSSNNDNSNNNGNTNAGNDGATVNTGTGNVGTTDGIISNGDSSSTGSGQKKRSIFQQRSVLDDLKMNNIRAVRIDTTTPPALPARLGRRLRVDRIGLAGNLGLPHPVPPVEKKIPMMKKRFVVDWEGVDSTEASDDS